MVFIFIILSLLIRIDPDPANVNRFDVVEVNHHLNDWNQEKWTQVIFWNWHDGHETHHVDHYYMLRDCYRKSKSGEIAHNKMLDILEQFIDDPRVRQKMREDSEYKGDFVETEMYPKKDWISGKWVIEFVNSDGKQRIECGAMQVTFTQQDPEMRDRKRQPAVMRGGLFKYNSSIIDALSEDLQKALQSL